MNNAVHRHDPIEFAVEVALLRFLPRKRLATIHEPIARSAQPRDDGSFYREHHGLTCLVSLSSWSLRSTARRAFLKAFRSLGDPPKKILPLRPLMVSVAQ